MSLSSTIYQHCPPVLRDVMVSLYGLKLKHQRYTGDYIRWRRFYQECQFESPAAWQARQQNAFTNLLESAARSRYYGPLLGNFSGRLEDLHQLPVLTKETLRQQSTDLLTHTLPKDAVRIYTSGTTGTPLTYYFARADYQKRMAMLDAYRSWFGVKNGDRRATFSGRIIVPERSPHIRQFWQTNWALNQRLYSTYHLGEAHLDRYLKNLNAFKPVFLDGYPSAIELIARYMLATGQSLGFKPKVIFVTAETLQPEARREIEQAFGCPVKNQYGSSEGAPLVVECEHGGLHLLPDSGIIEVSANGQACVTCFHTGLMPLIRYEIGDTFEQGPSSPCVCGRLYPRFGAITGREEDFLFACDGSRVGRLDPVFKGMRSTLLRTQIVQDRVGHIEVRYTPSDGFLPADLDSLKRELASRLGDNIQIDFIRMEQIPLGPNGKFKAVVCNCKNLPR